MYSGSVVINFNIFENTLFGIFSCEIVFKIDQFCFKRVEKRFNNGIVIAITFSAHTLYEFMMVQQIAKCLASILDTLIGMKDYP
jgi:hypothetical protein